MVEYENVIILNDMVIVKTHDNVISLSGFRREDDGCSVRLSNPHQAHLTRHGD
jgi:hypothetical protein